MKKYSKKETSNSKNKKRDNSNKRKESPQIRLFRIIKESLRNKQKISLSESKIINNISFKNKGNNENNENTKQCLIKEESSFSNIDETKENEKEEINKVEKTESLFNSQKAMLNVSIGIDLNNESINDEIALAKILLNKKLIKDISFKNYNKNEKNNNFHISFNRNKKIYKNISQKSILKNHDTLTFSPDLNISLKNNHKKLRYSIENERSTINDSNSVFSRTRISQKYTPVNRSALINNEKKIGDHKKRNYSNIDNNSIKIWSFDVINNSNISNERKSINSRSGNYFYIKQNKLNKKINDNYDNNFNYKITRILNFNNKSNTRFNKYIIKNNKNINNSKINVNNSKNNNVNNSNNTSINSQNFFMSNNRHHKKYLSLIFQESGKKNNNFDVNFKNKDNDIYFNKNKNIYNSDKKIMNLKYFHPKNNIIIMNNININRNVGAIDNSKVSNYLNSGRDKNVIDINGAKNSVNCDYYSINFNSFGFK